MHQLQSTLDNIFAQIDTSQGKVADYIPALACIPGDQFGMALQSVRDAQITQVGSAETCFSIQSISKVFSLTLALRMRGEELWNRVGREPSGNPFNSLVQLEYEQGIPRNPFINAGALVITDELINQTGGVEPAKQEMLKMLHQACCHEAITFDEEIATSEMEAGFRNAAMGNFLKSYGRLSNEVNEVLELYFHYCSISMSCVDLCKAAVFLANGGKSLISGEQIVTSSQAKRINAIMLTCGLYDAVGDFAYRVGLPAKSGVGGGIIAIVPGHHAITVWSPKLNKSGNSVAGTRALELFTDFTECSIF